MSKRTGLDNDTNTCQDASASDIPATDTDTNPRKAQCQESSENKAEERKNKIAFYKLFVFADNTDVVLMVVGTLAALANGTAMPFMTVIFGQTVNTFGKTTDPNKVVHEAAKEALNFVYLAIAAGVASFFQVACWVVAGERQAARIRNLYLKTILRQEITFFDKETNTGEVIARMSGDTILIQDAMGEKVGKFIQLVSTFFGGFLVAFVQGWLLTLVMLSSIPLLVISGAIVSNIITTTASRGQTAYSEAGTVVEQTVGSIRTVASFTGEQKAIDKYNKSLKTAYKSSVQEGLTAGLGIGMVMLIVFCTYALALWFGTRMIMEKGYTGGDVINIVFAVLAGSMSVSHSHFSGFENLVISYKMARISNH